jgi:hypothetical protein
MSATTDRNPKDLKKGMFFDLGKALLYTPDSTIEKFSGARRSSYSSWYTIYNKSKVELFK